MKKYIVLFCLCNIFFSAFASDTLYFYIDKAPKQIKNILIFSDAGNLTSDESEIYGKYESVGFIFQNIKKKEEKSIRIQADSLFGFTLKSSVVFFQDIFDRHATSLFLKYKAEKGFDTLKIKQELKNISGEDYVKLRNEKLQYSEWLKKIRQLDFFGIYSSIPMAELDIFLNKKKVIRLSSINSLSSFLSAQKKIENAIAMLVDINSQKDNFYIIRRVHFEK